MVADCCLYCIVEEQHGHGTGHGSLGIFTVSAHDRTGCRFQIIVGGGQDIQRIEHTDGIFCRHIDLDFISCVFIILVLVEIDHSLLDFVFVFFIQFRSIGDKAFESDSALKVAEVHACFFCNDIQAVTGDDRAVTDCHQYFIIGINQSKRSAHAGLGTFGHADAAGPHGQLRLVITHDRNACAFDCYRVIFSAVNRNGRFCVVHDNGHAARNRNIAVAAAYGSGHGLCRQETFVFTVHVLRSHRSEADVAVLPACRRFQITVNVDGTLVAVNADRDARRNGI